MIDSLLGAVILAFGGNLLQYLQSPTLDFKIVQPIIIIIVIITAVIITFYLILKNAGKLKKGKETIIDVYPQHALSSLSDLIKGAKEVYLLGITLQELQQITTTLETILKNEKNKIRILICDPDTKLMDEIEKIVYSSHEVNHRTAGKISSTIATLSDLKKYSNFEIIIHKLIPTHSIIIVNPYDESAIMQIEPYPYGTDREDRRVFKISKKKQKNLFDVYLKSYERMWEDAKKAISPSA